MNFHRNGPDSGPREIAVVDDAVPASGWMSVDLTRIMSVAAAPRPGSLPSPAEPVAETVTDDTPRGTTPAAGPGPVTGPLQPVQPLSLVPEAAAETPPPQTVRKAWPKRGEPRRQRPAPDATDPRPHLPRVPERDIILVRQTQPVVSRETPPAATDDEEDVLDLAREAVPVSAEAPRRRRWWLAALLVGVMAGGALYSFTRIGERQVISVPDPVRGDSVVT